jgi:uncharacterized protein (TIGR01370 family)
MGVVRIHLPETYEADTRVDIFALYKRRADSDVAQLFGEFKVGTDEIIDADAITGTSYFFTVKDDISLAESSGSPIARVFNKHDQVPFNLPILTQKSWAFVTSKINIDQLASSLFEVVVIDYSSDRGDTGAFSAEDITILKNSGKEVYGYVSLGMAETDRFYSPFLFNIDGQPLIHDVNPRNPKQYEVEYWDPLWTLKMQEYLNKLLATGFNGVFFDHANVYSNLTAYNANSFVDMRDLVITLATYARTTDPNFKVIVNKAEDFRNESTFRDAVSGIARNEVYFFEHDLTRDDHVDGNGNNYETKTSLLLAQELTEFLTLTNKPVYTYDYTLKMANSQFALQQSASRQFKPYSTQSDNGIIRVVL